MQDNDIMKKLSADLQKLFRNKNEIRESKESYYQSYDEYADAKKSLNTAIMRRTQEVFKYKQSSYFKMRDYQIK